ncbi:redoxin domain-containing protein [uncultured Algoriphagus sp.]|uniref:redoxin domain-containing protein n=1 Tax=uncultured Algoriphagus sp. TaxID=417365 RepID=UPI00258B10A2|nr:redoxin domain-containing protein [uncultured Algoriphagus sp.]
MKLKILFVFSFFIISQTIVAQSLGGISLQDAVTGKTQTIADLTDQKGLVLIYFDLNCPFTKMYEGRIKALRTKFSNQGFRFALIHSDSKASAEELKNYIDSSGMNMPFFIQSGTEANQGLGVVKIPEAFLISKQEDIPTVIYHGAIDNNPQAENAVSERFLERAINQFLGGNMPSPSQVRATGCNLRSF